LTACRDFKAHAGLPGENEAGGARQRTRVRYTTFGDGAQQKGGRVIEMHTGHDPMISEPARLTELNCSVILAACRRIKPKVHATSASIAAGGFPRWSAIARRGGSSGDA